MDSDPSLTEFTAAVGRPDGEIHLARAALLIAAAEQPGLDVEVYLTRLEGLADAAEPARRAADALSRLHRLREFLFEELGFAGDRTDYFDPRNSHLNEVLDRRLGIPITLSLVLIETGRRLGLEMEGIGLPGHFITGARIAGEHVLLDPFNRGAVLTIEACGQIVKRALGRPVRLTPEHFAPVDSRQFLTRMLANLKGIYWRQEAWDKVVRVIDRMLALNPAAAGERRDRGAAWSNMGRLERGVADWERYLTEFPNAADHDQVRSQLRRVRQKLARLN
ncbi:MAG TPA: transglutaminase-like domain-containing protein [Candidatus Nitrosotalea sp.]|jgi:regulator of sirC expression with transglutaminase-like and TPR domain|nr:transglutaminase-like domain-containing protein [Candidatus Nitrosotalea sp.]